MSKKKHEEEHENHERWLVSYADFITLLFAFFTVLYATSQKDVSKADEFQKSVQNSFRSVLDFGGVMGRFTGRHDHEQMIPSPIDLAPQEGPGPEKIEKDINESLEQGSGGDSLKDMVEISNDSEGVRVSLAMASFFDPGSALILEGALPTLDKIAMTLKKQRRKLVVEGHTDDVPIATEKFPSNWELSATRASTIVRYLITQHGFSSRRFKVVGWADQRPKAPNISARNRARNRRIDILITNEPLGKLDFKN